MEQYGHKYLKDEENQSGIYSPTAILQNLLFNNPLPIAMWQTKLSYSINILVLGAGTYGQKFIDLCLEVGQLPKHYIHITAISDNPERDRDAYLQFRPALNKFVTINGILDSSSKESYGTVDFLPVPRYDSDNRGHSAFSSKDMVVNRRIVEDIILNTSKNNDTTYQYVFISLGDDELNHAIADICVETIEILGSDISKTNCSVNFVVSDSNNTISSKGNPVYIAEHITTENINSQLYRMALNTHLSWNSTLNVDMNAEKKRFHERYNYESSLSFAFSIPYKLACLGINYKSKNDNISDSDLLDMATSFKNKIEDKQLLAEMSAYEHRRWVIEKLVHGWQAPLDKNGNIDYDKCVQMGRNLNRTNDSVNKIHPCIVRSTETMPLQEKAYQENNHERWNNARIDETLDELDIMSLRLHQAFRKEAETFRKSAPLNNGDFEAIRKIICDLDDEIIYAFKRFEFCLKHILNGSERYSRQYRNFASAFVGSLSHLPQEVQADINTRLQNLRSNFFSVIESNLYRDYKDNDTILVRNIPFILTFSPQPNLAMAFDDGRMHGGRNDDIFRNVASAMMLNPKKIIYLYCFDANSRTAFFLKKLNYVLNFFKSRSMKTHIGIRVALINFKKNEDNAKKSRAQNLITKLNDIGITDVTVNTVFSETEALKVLEDSLSDENVDLFDGTTSLFSTQFYNHAFIDAIDKRNYAYFEFDFSTKHFKICKNCKYLNYINDNSFIRIDDMFALRKATDHKFNLPEFASDYEKLWDIYTGGNFGKRTSDYEHNIANWTRMCNLLDQKDYVKFYLSLESSVQTAPILFTLPDYCYDSATYLLGRLKQCGAIEDTSCVNVTESNTCDVEINTRWLIKNGLEQVFMRPEKLVNPHLLRVESDANEGNVCIRVIFDSLDVFSLNMAAKNGSKDEWRNNKNFVFPLLQKLEEKGFIQNLRWDEGKIESKRINFSYSSPRIKRLLTKAGEILEIYVYYEVLKTGYFDDIASGYEFQWEYGGVENELDCVMTKGFRSLMVECKAKAIVEQDDYHTFNNLAEQFGIGCTKVIVANTYVPKFSEINKKQKKRGEQLNIITISEKDDIANIGDILKRIMEGTFK